MALKPPEEDPSPLDEAGLLATPLDQVLSRATDYQPQGTVSELRIFQGYVRDYCPRSDSYIVYDPSKLLVWKDCAAIHPYGTTGLGMGARTASGGYPPKTPVLVADFYGSRFILGMLPYATNNLKSQLPRYIVMRSNAGTAELAAPMHYEYLKQEEGVSYRPAGRPLDVIGGDWGHVNEFGLAIFLGRVMACLKASDMAKIEAFWGDDLLRIFGYNLQTYTAIREEYEVSDEGEGNLVRRSSPFAWEAIGAKEVKEEEQTVEETKARARDPQRRAWWEPKKKDQLILPRHTLMRGYMGDIEHEWISVPGKNMPDQEFFENQTKHVGVLEIAKNITGAYLIRSAKEISFEKSVLIPVPKELKAPDDPTGDNRKNYHAAGSEELGDAGATPELQEYEYPEMENANGWFRYLYEVQAWMYNRIVIGGLYLHTSEFGGKDWYLPKESDLTGEFDEAVQTASIDPSKLIIGNKFMVDLPAAAKLKVDHRTGHDAVRYYQSRSFVKMQEDGSIIMEDGYGSSIQMKGGSIFLSCVGDVFMHPGRNIVNWAPRDFIARAGNCMDLTAALKDIHIKAEKNIEVISGNGGTDGAMIFDCRSTGKPAKADFTEIGEDRKTKGIIFKAANSPVYIYGDDCYMGLTQNRGRITLDGQDGGEVYMRGKEVKAKTFEFNVIDPDAAKTLLRIFAGEIFLNVPQTWVNGSVYVKQAMQLGTYVEAEGAILSRSSIYAKNHFASQFGGDVSRAKEPPRGLPTPSKIEDTVTQEFTKVEEQTEEDEREVVDNEETSPGNEKFRTRVHFSCRKTSQYFGNQEGTFFMWETRWQSLGGTTLWDEPLVQRTGGGEPELPHPGRAAWRDTPKFKYLPNAKNYNKSTGIAGDRQSMSEQGESPKEGTLASEYYITTQE